MMGSSFIYTVEYYSAVKKDSFAHHILIGLGPLSHYTQLEVDVDGWVSSSPWGKRKQQADNAKKVLRQT